MQASAQAIPANRPTRSKFYLPREHGATAMLLTPVVGAAVLARSWHWSELAVPVAAIAAMSGKDPAVLLLRQQFVWKRKSPESASAARWLGLWLTALIASVSVLFATWPLRAFIAIGAAIAIFALIAVVVNLKGRQRSTVFQIASAAALTSTCLATCISALGSIAHWCWWYWALAAMQACAGILVVHARLDARIALRKPETGRHQFRRVAKLAAGALLCAGLAAMVLKKHWIAAALVLTAAGYSFDLVRQKDPRSLQMPLRVVGQQALALSIAYSALVIAGLW